MKQGVTYMFTDIKINLIVGQDFFASKKYVFVSKFIRAFVAK